MVNLECSIQYSTFLDKNHEMKSSCCYIMWSHLSQQWILFALQGTIPVTKNILLTFDKYVFITMCLNFPPLRNSLYIMISKFHVILFIKLDTFSSLFLCLIRQIYACLIIGRDCLEFPSNWQAFMHSLWARESVTYSECTMFSQVCAVWVHGIKTVAWQVMLSHQIHIIITRNKS